MVRLLRLLLVLLLSGFLIGVTAAASVQAESAPEKAGASRSQAVSVEYNKDEQNNVAPRKKVVTGPSKEEAEVTMRRELVYGLTLFDGGRYQGTFCPEEIHTIYVVANTDNVIAAHKTDVYFWPITREYMADWMKVNEKQSGSLEILKGNEVVRTLSLQKYTLFYPEGYLGGPTELIIGKRATEAVNDYKRKIGAHEEALAEYYKAYAEYDKLLDDFLRNPAAFGNKPPEEPAEPAPIMEYVMDIDDGFILNLGPGVYRVRLRDDHGNVVSGSTRSLVCFPALAKGIGYEIIPGEKWTYPSKSDDPGQTIFTPRSHTIYLKPFNELQYNLHHYVKLSKLNNPSSGRGMENQRGWVHVSPIASDGLTIELLKDNRVVSKIEEKPYYVKQGLGYTLGYDILEFTEEEFPGRTPSFTAFKIEMPKDVGGYQLRLVGRNGEVIRGSLRNLRTTGQPGLLALLAASSIPFVAGLLVIGLRSLRTGRISARWGRRARTTSPL